MRPSGKHWTELSALLSSFERCVVACARLDAYRPVKDDLAAVVDARLRALTEHVDHELDRVSVELLVAQQEAHVRRTAA